jgi:BirA family biotin operon repressor/biotin-[acetyl-CoA-carboxylase] ligase
VVLRETALDLARAARPSVENLVLHQRIDSTQDSAVRLMDQAEEEKIGLPVTLVVAFEQTRGRGRSGRTWLSPAGGLAMTWLASGLAIDTVRALPMIAAAAALDAAIRLGAEDAVIKWPNDIEAADGKLAGLLINARHGDPSWVAVGLGLNLERAPEIDDGAGTRAVAVGDVAGPASFEDRAAIAVGGFAAGLDAGIRSPAEAVERWRTGLRHRPGEEMTVRLADGTGVAGAFSRVTGEGHLVLDIGGGERIIPAGDVVE